MQKKGTKRKVTIKRLSIVTLLIEVLEVQEINTETFLQYCLRLATAPIAGISPELPPCASFISVKAPTGEICTSITIVRTSISKELFAFVLIDSFFRIIHQAAS